MNRVYFSVRRPPVGKSEEPREGGLQGLLGLSPTFVRSTHNPPLPTAPKDVATLSLTVLKDSESAARPVGRYLLHAKSYSVSGPCPPLSCGVFALCGILSLSLPLLREMTWVRSAPGEIGRALGKNLVQHFWLCGTRAAPRKEVSRQVAVSGIT